MSSFLSKRFEGIEAYVPGEQPQDRSYIKLNTNESPFPPSPRVLAALSSAAAGRLNLYPDPDTGAARAAIAGRFGLKPENVILGNGSDELLAFCFQAFCDARTPAVYADITYGFYKVYARINCVESRVIPLDVDFRLEARDYYNAGGTVFVANPNSPTGRDIELGDIEAIARENPLNAVVVDEAYSAFGSQSAVPLIDKYKNLLVVHTMSKSGNLAGARIAYALGDIDLIGDLNIMKFSFNPYNVSALSLLAAEAAIADSEYYAGCIGKLVQNREELASELRRRCFTVLPSSANFIFVKPGFIGGQEFYLELKKRGILVRHFANKRIRDYVRITIGDGGQMNGLISAVDDIMRCYGKDDHI
jgi:histidinol-phosphate aminotransferase